MNPHPLQFHQNKSIHFSLSNEFMVDIHLLSFCDYNLGPPSSFGTWISWFGKVPRIVVYKNAEITSLESLKFVPHVKFYKSICFRIKRSKDLDI